MIEYRSLKIALLGAGNVGAQVAKLLLEAGDELGSRVGARIELAGIAVRDVNAKREVELPRELLTTDAERLILGADIVVELMGGIEPARTLILKALNSGADVVTGNKALISQYGPELSDAAEQVGAQLYYEAAVAGAIPIIRPLRDSLAGDRIDRIYGIVNGSTNFILDRLERGGSVDEAMRVAFERGFLEADPTLDVEGYDAAQKAAILASLAFHTRVPLEAVYREGITGVSPAVVEQAKRLGYVVKLLAICERIPVSGTAGAFGAAGAGSAGVSARVYPALLPIQHPLAAVHDGNNAVFVQAQAAGDLMFYGAGAGGLPTASAVLGDVVSAARRHVAGGLGVAESTHAGLPLVGIDEISTRYLIILRIDDRPGALARIAQIFAENGTSIASLTQSSDAEGADSDRVSPATATLVIGTHEARESSLDATVSALEGSDAVRGIDSVLRIEGV